MFLRKGLKLQENPYSIDTEYRKGWEYVLDFTPSVHWNGIWVKVYLPKD